MTLSDVTNDAKGLLLSMATFRHVNIIRMLIFDTVTGVTFD